MRVFPLLGLVIGLGFFACESEPAPKSAADPHAGTITTIPSVVTSAIAAAVDAGGGSDAAVSDASPVQDAGLRPAVTILEPDATDRCDKDADCTLFDAQMCCHPSSGCTWRPGTAKGERAFRDYADHNFCPRARVICGEPNQCAKPDVALACRAHVCRPLIFGDAATTTTPSQPGRSPLTPATTPTLVEPTAATPKSACTRDSDCAFYSNQMCCTAERSCAFESRSGAAQAAYEKHEREFCPRARVKCAEVGACTTKGYGHNFEPACIDGACSLHRLPPPIPTTYGRPSHP